MASVEPQNERNRVYRFSTLPQSETEANRHEEQQPLSISTNPTIPTISNHSEEIIGVSRRSCLKIQDLLGVTMLILLIFFPLYNRHSGSPKQDPIPPIFKLNSMYISNFTIGSKGLAATWDTKFTISNTNVSWSIHFRSIEITIFYKQNPEDALTVASSEPFELYRGGDIKLHLKFITTETANWEADQEQPFVESSLVEEIRKDRERNNGTLSFGIQMKVQATYSDFDSTSVSDVVMTPYCEDLVVHFFPNKNSGRLVDLNKNFNVPIRWKPLPF